MEIGNALVRFRRHFGYTQKEVADKIGMLQQAYGRYEIGKNMPPASVIIKLADIFNVSTDYLLGRTDIPNTAANEQILKAAMQFNQAVNNAIQNEPNAE